MDVCDGPAPVVIAACTKVCLCCFAVYEDVMQLPCLPPQSSLAKRVVTRQAVPGRRVHVILCGWIAIDATLLKYYTASFTQQNTHALQARRVKQPYSSSLASTAMDLISLHSVTYLCSTRMPHQQGLLCNQTLVLLEVALIISLKH